MTIDQLPYLAPTPNDSFAHNAGGQSYKAILKDLVLLCYPVGRLWISSDPTPPSEIVGGTWVPVKDRFILAAGDIYTAGDTGGEAEHTLSIEEMPAHNHGLGINGAGSDYAHTVDWATSSTGSDTTGMVGGGQAHNNMPPYEVYYCWKRTA